MTPEQRHQYGKSLVDEGRCDDAVKEFTILASAPGWRAAAELEIAITQYRKGARVSGGLSVLHDKFAAVAKSARVSGSPEVVAEALYMVALIRHQMEDEDAWDAALKASSCYGQLVDFEARTTGLRKCAVLMDRIIVQSGV